MPTTSLLERFGGVRNWDYRYCWLRDATMTLQALLGSGFREEARAWREWLLRAVAGDPADLQIMYALVLAWAGLDRGVGAVERFGLPGDAQRWRSARDRIHAEVCDRGYDRRRNTFTQFYGSGALDAALLLLPRTGFLPWTDPRFVGTVEAVQRELSHEGLLLRYRTDAAGNSTACRTARVPS